MANYRPFVVATIVLMLTVEVRAAAGWTTVVEDGVGGIRVAGLRGMPFEDPEVGLVVACDADSAMPPLLTAVFPPTGDFSARPGDAAKLVVAGLRYEGALERSDSAQTSMWIELSDAQGLLEALSNTQWQVEVSLGSGRLSVMMNIPTQGLSESLYQIAQACPGLSR